MVLFAIVGELGTGKTLSAVALTFRNWYSKNKVVYSNIPLYKIPYHLIESVEQLDAMRNGVVLADEMWTLINARRAISKRNQLVSSILLKSRKRELIYFFTTQSMSLIDKVVRQMIDFTAYPVLMGGDVYRNEPYTVCKLYVFKGYSQRLNPSQLFRTIIYKTYLVYGMYDTNYEVSDIIENEKPDGFKIIFQEDKDSKPIYFDNWEDANNYARNYWNNYLNNEEVRYWFPFDDILVENKL
ncbi:MAG: hypothetical protein QXI77_00940 [Nanopusillaceae archaeon]|nr:zonular occludens toxin domain-containing protein [Candidatus Aenigmarchaeota archaeon]